MINTIISIISRPLLIGQGVASWPKALAPQCHTEAILAGPTSSQLQPCQPRSVVFKERRPLQGASTSGFSNKSFREKQEVGTELEAALGRQGSGLAASNLRCALALVPSCSGPRFPQLCSKGAGPAILPCPARGLSVSSC